MKTDEYIKHYTMNPNKIYVSEYKGKDSFDKDCHFVIVVAASDMNTAKKHVKELIGIDVEPTWLMGAVYHTIYNSTGNVPLTEQAKILSNNNYHAK
jgi:hypothetical protein